MLNKIENVRLSDSIASIIVVSSGKPKQPLEKNSVPYNNDDTFEAYNSNIMNKYFKSSKTRETNSEKREIRNTVFYDRSKLELFLEFETMIDRKESIEFPSTTKRGFFKRLKKNWRNPFLKGFLLILSGVSIVEKKIKPGFVTRSVKKIQEFENWENFEDNKRKNQDVKFLLCSEAEGNDKVLTLDDLIDAWYEDGKMRVAEELRQLEIRMSQTRLIAESKNQTKPQLEKKQAQERIQNKFDSQVLFIIADFSESGEWVEELKQMGNVKNVSILSSCDVGQKSQDVPFIGSLFINNWLALNKAIGIKKIDLKEFEKKTISHIRLADQECRFHGDLLKIASIFGLKIELSSKDKTDHSSIMENKQTTLFSKQIEGDDKVSQPNNLKKSENGLVSQLLNHPKEIGYYLGQMRYFNICENEPEEKRPHGFGALYRYGEETNAVIYGEWLEGICFEQINLDTSGKYKDASLKVIAGNLFFGNFVDDYLTKEGLCVTRLGSKWDGQFEKGRIFGNGKLSYRNGWRFKGRIGENHKWISINQVRSPDNHWYVQIENEEKTKKQSDEKQAGHSISGEFEDLRLTIDGESRYQFLQNRVINKKLPHTRKGIHILNQNTFLFELADNEGKEQNILIDDNGNIFQENLDEEKLNGIMVWVSPLNFRIELTIENGVVLYENDTEPKGLNELLRTMTKNSNKKVLTKSIFEKEVWLPDPSDPGNSFYVESSETQTFQSVFFGDPNGIGTWSDLTGCYYKGQFKNFLKHGQGIMVDFSGDSYEGEFKHDKRNGYGVLRKSNGDIYSGDWKNDSFYGGGVYTCANGEVWESFDNTKAEGEVHARFRNRRSQLPEFKEKLKHTKDWGRQNLDQEGMQPDSKNTENYLFNFSVDMPADTRNTHLIKVDSIVYPSKSEFKGSFINGHYRFRGRVYLANNNTFEGDIIDGEFNGEGIYIASNGDMYKGHWKSNMRHGIGTLITTDYIYDGEWNHNYKEGNGRLVYLETENQYDGEFKRDAFDGIGCYFWSNGKIHYGDWKNGQRHGFERSLLNKRPFHNRIWEDGFLKTSAIAPDPNHNDDPDKPRKFGWKNSEIINPIVEVELEPTKLMKNFSAIEKLKNRCISNPKQYFYTNFRIE